MFLGNPPTNVYQGIPQGVYMALRPIPEGPEPFNIHGLIQSSETVQIMMDGLDAVADFRQNYIRFKIPKESLELSSKFANASADAKFHGMAITGLGGPPLVFHGSLKSVMNNDGHDVVELGIEGYLPQR